MKINSLNSMIYSQNNIEFNKNNSFNNNRYNNFISFDGISEQQIAEFKAKSEILKKKIENTPLVFLLSGFNENGNKIGLKGYERVESVRRNSDISELSKQDEDFFQVQASSVIENAYSSDLQDRTRAAYNINLIHDKVIQDSLIEKFNNDHAQVRSALAENLAEIGRNDLVIKYVNDKYDFVKLGVISNIFYINDENLKKKLTRKFSNHRKENFRAAYALNSIKAQNKSEILKYSNDNLVKVRVSMAENIREINDEELKDKLIEKFKNDESYKVRNAINDISFFRDIDYQQEKYHKYVQNFDKNIQNIDKSKLLSFNNVVPSLILLENTNTDSKLIKKYIKEYNLLLDFTLKHKDKFIDEKISSEEKDLKIKNYFKLNAYKIINNLSLSSRGSMQEKILQKKSKFNSFIELTNDLINQNPQFDILENLYILSKEPYSDDKVDSSQRLQMLNLSYGLIKLDEEKLLSQKLEEMIENKKVNLKELRECFLQTFLDKNNIDIDVKNFKIAEKINFKYIHLIAPALKELNNSYGEVMKNIIKASFEDDEYEAFLNNNSDIKNANEKTKNIFKENGLNYDKWLNFDEEYKFTSDNGNKYLLKVWDRNNLGYSLFQGNYVENCTALDGDNKEGGIDDLANTFMQQVEIKNKDEVVGQLSLFWAMKKRLGKDQLILVIDSSDMANRLKHDKDITQNLEKFVKDYADAVSDKDYKIYYGSHNNFFDSKSKKKKTFTAQILGDCVSYKNDVPEYKYYINSCKKRHWSGIKYPIYLSLY